MAPPPKKPAAKPGATPPAKGAPPPKKTRSKLGFFTMMIILGIGAPFLMPTLTLIAIGMLPTLIALLTDSDPQKSGTAAVGAMNFAGTVPFVFDLWIQGQTMPNAFAILGQATTWLVMLGAAGIGQLILFAVPQAMATLTLARAESRVKLLRKNLETLKESWGPEVATSKPLDQIMQG